MYIYNQTDNNINNMPVGLPFREREVRCLSAAYLLHWLASISGWLAGSRQASSRRTESLLMMWDKSSISKHQTMADTNRVGQTIHLSNCHRRDSSSQSRSIELRRAEPLYRVFHISVGIYHKVENNSTSWLVKYGFCKKSLQNATLNWLNTFFMITPLDMY